MTNECTCTHPQTTPLDPNGNILTGSFGTTCPPCVKHNFTEQAATFEQAADEITKISAYNPELTFEQVEKAFRDRATELRNHAANIDMNN